MAIFGRQFGLQATVPAPQLARLDAAEGVVEAKTGDRAEISLANILLLIPADIVTVYMTGKGITRAITPGAAGAPPAFIDQNWILIAFVTCAVACFLFRLQATKPAGDGASWRDANWGLAFWTTIAFVLWAHAVSDVGPLVSWFAGAYAAFFAGLFGVFAPRLVRADTLAA